MAQLCSCMLSVAKEVTSEVDITSCQFLPVDLNVAFNTLKCHARCIEKYGQICSRNQESAPI